mmetsp:Transcript_20620/g.55463  ORF Transcript_20620/g.55463 Transcript_20620/m.55463 type:complete len:230 (+) Transcript_20620:202-891(+)
MRNGGPTPSCQGATRLHTCHKSRRFRLGLAGAESIYARLSLSQSGSRIELRPGCCSHPRHGRPNSEAQPPWPSTHPNARTRTRTHTHAPHLQLQRFAARAAIEPRRPTSPQGVPSAARASRKHHCHARDSDGTGDGGDASRRQSLEERRRRRGAEVGLEAQQVALEHGDGHLADGGHERALVLDSLLKVLKLREVDADRPRLDAGARHNKALGRHAGHDHVGRLQSVLL